MSIKFEAQAGYAGTALNKAEKDEAAYVALLEDARKEHRCTNRKGDCHLFYFKF